MPSPNCLNHDRTSTEINMAINWQDGSKKALLMDRFEYMYKIFPFCTKSIERLDNPSNHTGPFYCDPDTDAMFSMFVAGFATGEHHGQQGDPTQEND